MYDPCSHSHYLIFYNFLSKCLSFPERYRSDHNEGQIPQSGRSLSLRLAALQRAFLRVFRLLDAQEARVCRQAVQITASGKAKADYFKRLRRQSTGPKFQFIEE